MVRRMVTIVETFKETYIFEEFQMDAEELGRHFRETENEVEYLQQVIKELEFRVVELEKRTIEDLVRDLRDDLNLTQQKLVNAQMKVEAQRDRAEEAESKLKTWTIMSSP